MENDEHDLDKRCDRWSKEFKQLFDPQPFKYDKLAWRRDALKPNKKQTVEWDDFKQAQMGRMEFKMGKNFYDSNWVLFHKAALKQRHYVLENLL